MLPVPSFKQHSSRLLAIVYDHWTRTMSKTPAQSAATLPKGTKHLSNRSGPYAESIDLRKLCRQVPRLHRQAQAWAAGTSFQVSPVDQWLWQGVVLVHISLVQRHPHLRARQLTVLQAAITPQCSRWQKCTGPARAGQCSL